MGLFTLQWLGCANVGLYHSSFTTSNACKFQHRTMNMSNTFKKCVHPTLDMVKSLLTPKSLDIVSVGNSKLIRGFRHSVTSRGWFKCIEFKKWFPRSLSPDNQWNRTIASDTSVLLRWPRVSRSIPSTCARNLWLGPLQKVPGMSLGWWCIGSDRIFFQILNTQDGLFSFPMTLWLDKAKHKITGTYCMFTCYVYAIGFADCPNYQDITSCDPGALSKQAAILSWTIHVAPSSLFRS